MSQISSTDTTALTRSRKNAIDETPDLNANVLHQSQEKPSPNLQQKLDDQINHPLTSQQNKAGLELAKDLLQTHGTLKAKHQDVVNSYNNLVDQIKNVAVDDDELTEEDITELLKDLDHLETPVFKENDFTRPRSRHVDISQGGDSNSAQSSPSNDDHLATQQSDPQKFRQSESSISAHENDISNRNSIADENQFFDFIDSLVEENENQNNVDRPRLDSQPSPPTSNDSGSQQQLGTQTATNSVNHSIENTEKSTQSTARADAPNQSPKRNDEPDSNTRASSNANNSSLNEPANHTKTSNETNDPKVHPNVIVVSTAVKKPSAEDIKAAANQAGGVIASRIEDAAKGPSGAKVEIPLEAIGKFLNGSPGLGWRPQIQKGAQQNELIRTDPSNPKSKHVQFRINNEGHLVLKIIDKNINWGKQIAAKNASGGGLIPENNGKDLDFTFQFSQKACSKAFNHQTTLSDGVLKNVRFSSCEVTDSGLVLTKK